MKNRDYKLYSAVQFLLNRKNYLISATCEREKGLLQKSYNKALLELKEILNIKDSMEIIQVNHDRVVIPKKYYKQSIKLFKESKIHGFLTDNTIIFVK